MSVSACVSLSRWLFTYRHRSQVSTLTDTDICTLAHTYYARSTLRSSDVLPLGPLITCGRGRAAGSKGVMEAGRAQRWSKRNSFTGAECDVVKWDQAAYLSHAPSHSSSPSVTHFLIHSISHSLIYLLIHPSLTHCVTTQTSRSIKQSVTVTLKDEKNGLCAYYKCLFSSFVVVEQLAEVEVYERHPSASWVSALQSRPVGWCCCNALVCTYTFLLFCI